MHAHTNSCAHLYIRTHEHTHKCTHAHKYTRTQRTQAHTHTCTHAVVRQKKTQGGEAVLLSAGSSTSLPQRRLRTRVPSTLHHPSNNHTPHKFNRKLSEPKTGAVELFPRDSAGRGQGETEGVEVSVMPTVTGATEVLEVSVGRGPAVTGAEDEESGLGITMIIIPLTHTHDQVPSESVPMHPAHVGTLYRHDKVYRNTVTYSCTPPPLSLSLPHPPP